MVSRTIFICATVNTLISRKIKHINVKMTKLLAGKVLGILNS